MSSVNNMASHPIMFKFIKSLFAHMDEFPRMRAYH